MRNSASAVLFTVSVLCGLSSSGCGYSLAGRGSFLPASIQTIGIPAFLNRTAIFNLETTLTAKVRSEFVTRGKYTIVPEATGVDALLSGEITSATITPASFNQNSQLASRYAITMTARVELRDAKANVVLWENASLVFRQEYDAAGAQAGQTSVDPAAFFGQDAQALDRITTEFARTIVSSILEAF
jgi:Lipopolysaccharide-assembly